MGEVAGRRMTAEIEGDFVVFLIGARLNSMRQVARSVVDPGGRPRQGRTIGAGVGVVDRPGAVEVAECRTGRGARDRGSGSGSAAGLKALTLHGLAVVEHARSGVGLHGLQPRELALAPDACP